MYMTSAQPIWSSLEKMISLTNWSNKYKLSRDLYVLKQHKSTVTEYNMLECNRLSEVASRTQGQVHESNTQTKTKLQSRVVEGKISNIHLKWLQQLKSRGHWTLTKNLFHRMVLNTILEKHKINIYLADTKCWARSPGPGQSLNVEKLRGRLGKHKKKKY